MGGTTGIWEVHRDHEAGGERMALRCGTETMSFADVLARWRDDPNFRDLMIAELAGSPYPAFWEMPALRRDTLDRPFECVLLKSPVLAAMSAHPGAFAEKFAAPPESQILVFANLGGDATLIVPRAAPATEASAYAHAAAFFRTAPRAQRHELLRVLAAAVTERLSDQPLWISTCGLGVPWLHVRLDRWPKYYSHGPYRDAR